MTKGGMLGTFEHHAENSEFVARSLEVGGMAVVRIHRDEPPVAKTRKVLACDVIYGTGLGFAWKLVLLARFAGKRTINHWMGTDVLMASTDSRKRSMASLASRFITIHLTQAAWLADELKAVGIQAAVLPLVTDLDLRAMRANPGKSGVLTYLPDQRAEFYGATQILQLADAFPDLPFCVVAGQNGPKRPNIRYCGWVEDLSALYNQYPILVRLAQHDGLPKMVLEALSIGNQVVFNYPFPHWLHASTYGEALAAIRAVLDRGCRFNAGAHDFVAEYFDPAQLRHDLLRVMDPAYGR